MKEDNPDALEAVLKHAYHGVLVGLDDPDPIKTLNLCSAQHEVADKYFFNGLKQALCAEFSKCLVKYIKENAKQNSLDTPAFTQAIARVYFRGNSNENSLARLLVDNIFGFPTDMITLIDTWAKIGQEVPEFGADMFSRSMGNFSILFVLLWTNSRKRKEAVRPTIIYYFARLDAYVVRMTSQSVSLRRRCL